MGADYANRIEGWETRDRASRNAAGDRAGPRVVPGICGIAFSLCFQSFEKELAELPGMYAPPEGRLLLAKIECRPVGCAALDKLTPEICEMKRLYVKPEARGTGLGRKLAERLIIEARAIGYRKMRLDTVAGKMDAAIALYRRLGFKEIGPYRENPIPGALYTELELAQRH